MSLALLPADLVAKVNEFFLSPYPWTMRIGDNKEHPRLLDVVRALSTDKAAWALYESEPRFKALLFCAIDPKPSFGDATDSDGWSSARERRLGRPRRGPRLRSPDAWGRDRGIVLAAAKINGTSLRLSADDSFLDDREIAILALHTEMISRSWDERAYVHLSERLRADPDVVRAAFAKKGQTHSCFMYTPTDKDLELFPASIRDNKDLMLEIMREARQNYAPLNLASERLRGDREVVMAAVSQTFQWLPVRGPQPNLQYASSALRDDRAVVEASVRATGGFGSLALASERLRDDMELAALAVEKYAPALEVYVDAGYEAMSMRIRSNCGLFLEILAKVDDPKAQWSGMPSPVSRAYILHGKAAPVLQRDELVLRACAAATQAAMKAHDSDEGD